MLSVGYKLSSEEHAPRDLVRYARAAEESGFSFALISDHYHPWTDKQGQSPFVWSVIGAIAQVTERLELGTAVTCPTVRMHPAIVAQAAATAAAMMPGRFSLGLGTGEALNEHVTGAHWPPAHVRREMLTEAVTVIRRLWEGRLTSHSGEHYEVHNARVYSLPKRPPPILVAAGGPATAHLAATIGDGLVTTAPDPGLVKAFEKAGGRGKPCYVELTVCWARSEAEARRTAHAWWPIAAMPGPLARELALPSHVEAAAKLVTEEAVAAKVVCGPDAARHVDAIRQHARAGYGHVCVHQVGPDQEGFLQFYAREVLPRVRTLRAVA
jgi:G6PDH family F420-dependent oxidoreductase